MAVRTCVDCGAPVTSATCEQCGAVQPPGAPPTPETTGQDTGAAPPTVRGTPVVLPVEDDDDDPAALRTAEQPWHPFEQPSWLDATADPRALVAGGFRSTGPDGADLMDVNRWEDDRETVVADERRHPWLLGALAAVAVIVVLAAAAFFLLRDRSAAEPGPTTESAPAPVTVSADTATSATDPVPSATDSAASSVVPTVESSAEVTSSAPDTTAAGDPLGGPQRDIACAPGFVVQIASAGDETAFVARVAELRAAGQLPPDVAVARTASSCAIFAGQSNSVVLYAGPFTDAYGGCAARLAGAPDSFIKGTTPETATQYVSCLCPTQVVTIPTFTAIGQTGVWAGELQRILANRLDIPITDLDGNWGTFTDGTSAAVRTFQTASGLPATGTVDAATWQALQQAQC